MSKKNILIGVAWPYVNGTLHIGHMAGYLLPADICSRYQRAIGNNVLMVSGSDCFGTPTTVEADKKGVKPQDIVNEYHTKNVELFLNTAKFTYDLYTKTDNPTHIKQTQDMFISMLEKGYIFVDSTNQYYSPTENRFLPDRYVVGTCPFCNFNDARSDQCDNCGKLINHGELINPVSNINKEPVILKETEHYFVDWSKLQPFLEDYFKTHSKNWKEWVKSETRGWLDEGLKPRAITRDLDWGVPIPKDRISDEFLIKDIDKKRIYVWFDAVIGYLSASKLWAEKNDQEWKQFWFNNSTDDLYHYYFMGKDNLVFHCLFWPGQLHSHDEKLHLPDQVSINMFLDFDGKQFSKSRGVSINIEDIIKEYGNDAVRFYLTLIMPETKDSSFVWSDFEEKVNGVLVATLGNFIHRVLSIGKKEDVSIFKDKVFSEDTVEKIKHSFINSREYLDKCEYRAYLDKILDLAQYGNKLVDKNELWNLKKQDETEYSDVLFDLYAIILALSYLMSPLLFEASEVLRSYFGINDDKWPSQNEEISHLKNLLNNLSEFPRNPKPLFNKIEINL